MRSLAPSANPDQGLNQYLIALGSNLGDRVAHLRQAAASLEPELGRVLAHASLFETAPVGGVATADFLNSAVILASALSPDQIMGGLLRLEAEHGRQRRQRWDNRPLDLDLLLWRRASDTATMTWTSDLVVLPHPRMLERDFVLVPAAEIAPDWLCPGSTKTLAEERLARGYVLKPLLGWTSASNRDA